MHRLGSLLLLVLVAATFASACASDTPAVEIDRANESLFEAWVPYATGTPTCLEKQGTARDVLVQLAEDVHAGDVDAVSTYDRSDPRVLCAAAHLVEDVGGIDHGHDDDLQPNDHACHNMAPEHRRLLRLIFDSRREQRL